mgnify:CR=1 FL=1
MKQIELTQNKYTLVDDEDFAYLNQWKWHFNKSRKNDVGRAARIVNRKMIYMSRLIMNPPKNKQIDHIDGNSLNNQKENLRVCSNAENLRNRSKQRNNFSGFKGVSWDKSRNNWRVAIQINKKDMFLGRFKTKEKAALTYNKAAKKYFKMFARLNSV